LRILTKKLRYALEFADELHSAKPGRRKKFEKGLRHLQESLGTLHDGVTARACVTLNPWLEADEPDQNELQLVHHADRALKRLRRMGAYW
jgi:CHAD domain-containing protein